VGKLLTGDLAGDQAFNGKVMNAELARAQAEHRGPGRPSALEMRARGTHLRDQGSNNAQYLLRRSIPLTSFWTSMPMSKTSCLGVAGNMPISPFKALIYRDFGMAG
jgi:hypothetical protein